MPPYIDPDTGLLRRISDHAAVGIEASIQRTSNPRRTILRYQTVPRSTDPSIPEFRARVVSMRPRWQGIADPAERTLAVWANVIHAGIEQYGVTTDNPLQKPKPWSTITMRTDSQWSMDYRDSKRSWKLLKQLRPQNRDLPTCIRMADGTIHQGQAAREIKRQCLQAKFADPAETYPDEWQVKWPAISAKIDVTIDNMPLSRIDPSLLHTIQMEDMYDLRRKLKRRKKSSSDLTTNDWIIEMPDEEFEALVTSHWIPVATGNQPLMEESRTANLLLAYKKNDALLEANHRALTHQSHDLKFCERTTRARVDRAWTGILPHDFFGFLKDKGVSLELLMVRSGLDHARLDRRTIVILATDVGGAFDKALRAAIRQIYERIGKHARFRQRRDLSKPMFKEAGHPNQRVPKGVETNILAIPGSLKLPLRPPPISEDLPLPLGRFSPSFPPPPYCNSGEGVLLPSIQIQFLGIPICSFNIKDTLKGLLCIS